LILAALPALLFAQATPGTPGWTGVRQDTAPYPSPSGANFSASSGTSAATDAQGNVILVGSTDGTFTPSLGPLAQGAFAAKYSPAGALLWARRLLDQSNIFGVGEGAYGVAVDSSGNIYVTGETLNALPNEVSAGGLDVFIAKFNPGGTRLWAHQFGSNRNDRARGIAVDAAGNATLVGYTDGQLPQQPAVFGEDFFIAKYDSLGRRLSLQAVDLGRGEEAFGVALDTAGNVYVSGTTYQQAGDFAGFKGFAAKFNARGARQWLSLIGETTFPTVQANAIAVAADGSRVYVAGRTVQNFDLPGQPTITTIGDAFVARLSGANGARNWIHNLSSQTQPGPRYFEDSALGIATDATGSAAFLTGVTAGVMPGQTSKGAEDVFVARYGASGTRSWVRQLGSGLPVASTAVPNDRGAGIVLNRQGDVFVTGSTIGTFGAKPRNIDRPNWFVLKMKPGDGGLY
jgi:hypothetical protein